MKTLIVLCATALFALNACATQSGVTPAPSSNQQVGVCGVSAAPCGTKPDIAKTRAHLAQHVNYPASRAEILAACAQTPEFTAAEKQWLTDNLPEGKYASADDVGRALKL
jgi:hypothetical protein